MRIEELVRRCVEDHTAVAPPHVDASALVRRARRRVATTVVGTALVCAALVVGGVGLAGGLPGSSADDRGAPAGEGISVGPQPVPGPSEVVQLEDGRLQVDGDIVSTAAGSARARLTANGVAYTDDDGVPHLVTTDGQDVQLAPDHPADQDANYAGWVAADSSNPLVAWTEMDFDDAGVDVVAYDTEALSEVGRLSLDCTVRGRSTSCPFAEVVSDGVVFFVGADDRQYGWEPTGRGEGAPFLVRGPVMAAHYETILRPSGWPGATYAGLDEWWTVTPAVRQHATLSYDGRFLLSPRGTLTSLEDPDTSLTFEPDGEVVEAAFDMDGSVLLVVDADDGYQALDCEPSTGDCAAISAVEPFAMRLAGSGV